MDGLALAATVITPNSPNNRSSLPFCTPTATRRIPNVYFRRKPSKLVVFASNDDPEFDQWDLMELKFGQLLGEDPKLTLAKVRAKKLYPNVSYLEIEKLFKKNKGKFEEVEELPFNVPEKGKSSNSLKGLNLVRPVPKKGVKFKVDNKRPRQPLKKPVDNSRRILPRIILRKPTAHNQDDSETEISSKLKIKPNLSLNMGGKQTKEKFSDITFLQKPELVSRNLNLDKNQEPSGGFKDKVSDILEDISRRIASVSPQGNNDATLLKQPKRKVLSLNVSGKEQSSDDHEGSISVDVLEENSSATLNQYTEKVHMVESNYAESTATVNASCSKDSGFQGYSSTGLQSLEQSEIGSADNSTVAYATSPRKAVNSNVKFPVENALLGKPKRLGQSLKLSSKVSREEIDPESYGTAAELGSSLAKSPVKMQEHEDEDWRRVQDLVETGGREEVKLISPSTRGFVACTVSFGSLMGFLPYSTLASKFIFLAFESWLMEKGLDPSKYKPNFGNIKNNEIEYKASIDSNQGLEIDEKEDLEISRDIKQEDLLRMYAQEKRKFLLSFVGQNIKAYVLLADRKSGKLIFSLKPKDEVEMVEKKRSLMAKLSIGDVVKCCIQKISYFGIFVEVEGVPALIHQTEMSWDATLEPALYFKVGQIVEAKVHQLDFQLQRISLSLKELTSDPLTESLEAVIGNQNSLDGRLEAGQGDTEWADVESLIKELQKVEGIQSVLKGRFFLSPGLAPTFQVYMASVFENEFKLLARAGKRVQEVIVRTSLGEQEMKSAILTCTNRVE